MIQRMNVGNVANERVNTQNTLSKEWNYMRKERRRERDLKVQKKEIEKGVVEYACVWLCVAESEAKAELNVNIVV